MNRMTNKSETHAYGTSLQMIDLFAGTGAFSSAFLSASHGDRFFPIPAGGTGSANTPCFQHPACDRSRKK